MNHQKGRSFIRYNGFALLHFIQKIASTILVVALIPTIFHTTNTRAQSTITFIRRVRSFEAVDFGLAHPAGLAFSNQAQAFQILDAPQATSNNTEIVKLTDLVERAGSVRLAAAVKNPINSTFDNKSNRFLFFAEQANRLVTIQADGEGNLDPAALSHYDAKVFGLHNPRGVSIDEKNGKLFVLDAAGPRIVHATSAPDGSFNAASIAEIDLRTLGISSVSGIAVNPASENLFVVDPVENKLYELTQSGQLAATRDLAQFHLKNPQAMTFAPSGDQTDDPAQMSLYVADSGFVDGQDPATDTGSTGQVVEFSLAPLVEPAVASITASLIRTTDMAAISPPSPDPSGITFLPNSNTLMVVDGEVEETISGITHFQGANVWELTLLGGNARTANISNVPPTFTPMTNEPTDVAWNPGNGHYYVTDDNDKRVYDLNPGGDGMVGTADDTWTSFSTNGARSGDPEGITFNIWTNHIFVADGMNAEVYEFTTSGTLINHFDVEQYGVADPEDIEFNPETGTLYTMSSNQSTPVIVETTISGALLQTVNISAVNPIAVAGLAYAPASNGSGSKRFYIVDRGIDNNDNPNIVDGKLYEITAPTPVSAQVDVTIGLNLEGTYDIPYHGSEMMHYGMVGGPAQVVSRNGVPIFTSQRAYYGNSYNELMGYPADQFTSEYWFPWYDQVNLQTWILVGNPSASQTAYVNIYIGGSQRADLNGQIRTYAIPPGNRITPQFPGVVNGPVKVVSVPGAGTPTPLNIFASERSLYGDSFNEVMGYPGNQFTTEYWFPWYDQRFMQSWVLVGNPSTTQTAYVNIYIHGSQRADLNGQIQTYAIPPGGSVTPQFPNVLDGAVRVVSVPGAGTPTPLNIFTSERSLYGTSFNEVMGYPASQFSSEYHYPWYDNLGMQTWLLVGNPSASQSAYVEIYIDGIKLGSYSIPPGGNVTPQFSSNAGPVRVVSVPGAGTPSALPIFTSERSLYATSFNEMMGYPSSQLTSEYWFTWYDSVNMVSRVLVGRP